MVVTSESENTGNRPKRNWHPGVRARLLLAFLGITTFAVMASGVGIFSFREVGRHLDIIDSRIPPTLSAFELSRSAERIISAAPTLLAATDPIRQELAKAEIATAMAGLQRELDGLKDEDAEHFPIGNIEELVNSLLANLGILKELVSHRLEANGRINSLRENAFQVGKEIRRLLAPWLLVVGSQIDMLVDTAATGGDDTDGKIPTLASLIATRQLLRSAQIEVSTVMNMLSEAAAASEQRRLPVLTLQLGLALRKLEGMVKEFDPKLRSLFLLQLKKLQGHIEGTDTIADARSRELTLIGQGDRLLAETRALSEKLTVAIDQLGIVAKLEIGDAISDVLSVQQRSTRTLLLAVALSLLTSILIVWRYVGGNIVSRLTQLSSATLAIAAGRLDTEVTVEGSDEISAMARAIEILRRNTLERDEFETANRYKSRFLASASHDLRQPISALTLFVAQLHNESDPEERSRLITRIDTAVSAMNKLFQALLDMSKIDAGALEPNFGKFPIAPLLSRMESTFAQIAGNKGVRLRTVSSSVWVNSDTILLERIMLNLVSNAVRNTTHGGVVIGCRRRGEKLRVDVCDSGPGIAPEHLQSIFQEHVQLEPTVPGTHDGLGLGLAIVDRLSRLLDHKIEIASSVGKGSRFSILVPIAAAEAGSMAVAASPPGITDPAQGKCIAVIDDDALVLSGIGGILQSWGSEVITAESAEQAVAALSLRSQKPHLIISDYRLKNERTGIETINTLRNDFGDAIPAFLISGDTSPEVTNDAQKHNFQLLHKPVSPLRLRALINRLLKPDSMLG